MSESPFIAVAGVGSHAGDDAVGWLAIELLRGRCGHDAGLRLEACARPVASILQALAGADAGILIDAVRSGAEPGTLHRMEAGELPAWSRGLLSSHGCGVIEALALGRALEMLPSRVVVYGVELERCDPAEGVSERVRLRLPDLVAAVADEAGRLGAAGCGRDRENVCAVHMLI